MTTVDVPDGGWGWVIVACSFLVHMLLVGTMYALSVLYRPWLEHFNSGHGLTSWIISLAVAFTFAIGPLPGSLSKRLGNRAVVIAGGLLSALGFFVSVFAPNVYCLMVSIGLITGTGAGFCFLPSISLVTMYFTTKRSLAMGISASGLGVGAFFMAPFLNWLVDFYGWRGCMLICSGISLNMCVLGTLMLPVEQAPKWSCGTSSRRTSEEGSISREGGEEEEKKEFVEMYDEEKLRLSGGDGLSGCGEVTFVRHDQYHQLDKLSGTDHRRPVSNHMEMNISGQDSPDKSSKTFRKYLTNEIAQNGCLNQSEGTPSQTDGFLIQPSEIKSASTIVPLLKGSSDVCHYPNNSSSVSDFSKHSHTLIDSEHIVPNISCAKSLVNHRVGSLQVLSNLPTDGKPYASNVELSSTPGQSISVSKLHDIQAMLGGSLSAFVFLSKHSLVSVHSHRGMWSGDTTDGTPESSTDGGSSFSVYVRLLCHAQFMWFCVSNFITNLSFFMPVLYMVDRAVDYGISKADAAMLISIYGAGNILGKLGLGFLADRGLVDRMLIYIVCLTSCGVATCLSPLCGTHQWMHTVYAFLFGFFIGGYVTLFPLVTVDLLGLCDVGEVFGLLLAFMGVGIVLGTPVGGWIFDWTGSYTISFILHGGFIVFSAAMCVPLWVKKKQRSSLYPVVDLE